MRWIGSGRFDGRIGDGDGPRACDATDFRPSINGAGGACASRRTLWESSRERWRDGAGCYRTSGFRPPRSLHAYWCGHETRPIFDHRETGSAVLARAGAWSRRVAESDGATGQAVTGPRDFGPVGRCTHVGVGGRRDRFSTIDKRGRRCLREPAHGLRECRGAMARAGCRTSRFRPRRSLHAYWRGRATRTIFDHR